MEGGFTAQDYHIFCWVIKVCLLHASYMLYLDSGSQYEHLDYTTQNKNSPKVLDDLSSRLFLPEDFILM